MTAAPDLDRVPSSDPRLSGGTRRRGTPTPPSSTTERRFETVLALGAVGLLGLRMDLKSGITSGLAVALLLLPVWVPALRRFTGARLFVVLGVLAGVSGVLLAEVATPAPVVNANVRTNTLAVLAGLVCGVGVVLWARTLTSSRLIGLAFGAGMLAAAVLQRGGTENAWKFVWAVPTAVFVLSLADRGQRPGHRSRRGLELVILGVLALLSGVFDSRSYLATFVLAAVLIVVPLRPGALRRRASWLWVTAMLVAVAAAVYYLATTLLVDGYLGQAAQTRSIRQIETSGSLLLGGRPELAASAALFRWHPQGFGAGVVPSPDTIMTAKEGLAAINYDPDNGYVDGYMFGGHIELHSTAGDLWANFGLPGLALAVLIGVLVIVGLSQGIARSSASAATVFLCCWALWNLPFSPLFGSSSTLTLGIGLALGLRQTRPAGAVVAPDQPLLRG